MVANDEIANERVAGNWCILAIFVAAWVFTSLRRSLIGVLIVHLALSAIFLFRETSIDAQDRDFVYAFSIALMLIFTNVALLVAGAAILLLTVALRRLLCKNETNDLA